MANQVPAATRTLAVLRYLARHPRPVSAAAIARDLDLPRSTTYHLLTALEAEGFVTHLPEERRYGLGLAAFELGSAYLRQDGLERLGRPVLAQLVEEVARDGIRAVGHLGVLDGREMLYLAKVAPAGADLLVTEVGVRLPAHLTATGRCLLAALPSAQLTALYPGGRPLTRRTEQGPASPSELRRLLAADRARGWSQEDGEVSEGFGSVAAASFDHTARPVASLGLTLRAAAHEDGAQGSAIRGELAARVCHHARRLTDRLGGQVPASVRASVSTRAPTSASASASADLSG